MSQTRNLLKSSDRWEIDDIQKYKVLTALQKETFGTHGEVVINYMNSRDVPPWFRGASKFQINAANRLCYALRDDAEQHTTHRVNECICDMGLSPLICKKDINQLIRLSRGNDLAFLWFLFELHYKTHGVNFSINEQIILCLIAHLDMIPTLRELDRVLPPPQPTKKEIARKKRMEELKLANSHKRKRKRKEHVLPYFQKLVRPKLLHPKIIIGRPDFVVTFQEYDSWKDPNFVQPNETNRWFANYKTNVNRRITQRIVEDEVYGIFNKFSNVSIRPDTVKTLCERHKTIMELEKKLECKLKVIARDRCTKYFDTEGKHKEEVQKRIAEQIDKDVAAHLKEFKKLAEKSRIESYYNILKSNCDDDNYDDDKGIDEFGVRDMYKNINYEHDLVEDNRCVNFSDLMASKLGEEKCKILSSKEESTKSHGDDSTRGKSELNEIFLATQKKYDYSLEGFGDCRMEKSSSSSEQDVVRQEGGDDEPANRKEIRNKKTQKYDSRRTSMSDFTEKYLRPYDFAHGDCKTPNQSNTFFKAPSKSSPYLFDYRKIFRLSDNSKESISIKKAFLEALNNDIKHLTQLQDDEILPDYEEPVDKLAKQTWHESLAKRREDIRRRELFMAEHELKQSPIGYNEDYYDPDNQELMNTMLRDAMQYIKQDPKFVLASIPQAHKLPLFREWIAQRFGKVYTPKERFHLYKISAEIFRSLDKLERYVRAPKPENFTKRKNHYWMDYVCIKKESSKTKSPKTDYDNKMVATLMEQSRVYWYVMCPHLCSNGPPVEIYYAYMPSRPKDITRFRVWKPREFMDAKSAWEARRMNKKPLKAFALKATKNHTQ